MKKLTKYLVPASKNMILECGQTIDQMPGKELEDLVIVQLNGLYLKNVEHLQYCFSLKICILSNNFIANIDSLVSCPHLVELDLHGNQIQHLPGPVFWESMKKLNLLYLHDNGIGKLDDVHALSCCPNLIGLTLFDTPLSLKIAYRHSVVNSIFSLKALDYYVISDEEIVEGWKLPEKYKSFCHCLFLDSCPVARKEGNAEEALNRVKDVISKINRVLAHHSPIIIVQRWIRGYLTRKRLGIPLHEVPLQTHYRDEDKQIYSQSTPSVCISKSFVYHIVKPGQNTKDEKHSSGKQKTKSGMSSTEDVGTRITVDLAKLRDRVRKVLHMNDFKELPGLCLGRRQPITSTLPILRKREKINVKQEGSLWRKGPLKMENTDMKKQTEMKFSPSTSKNPFHPADKLTPFQDKPATWCELQQCHFHSHSAPQHNARHHPVSLEKRVFARMYGSIRFGPFYVIDKFYSENEQHDSQAQKLCKVTQMQIAKEKGSRYVQEFLEEKQRSIQKKREEEGLRTEKALQQHQKKRARFIENVRQRHTQFLESKKQKAFEYSLGQDFSARHIALTQGLLKLDRWRKLGDGIKERQRIVEESREQMRKFKQLIKNFQDQRQLRIQKENLAEKTIVASVVSQKPNERLQEAKASVERVKERRTKVECLYKAPVLPVSDI
nr:PREDICTED: leucine-rich repeat and IQ domain-containing protein 3 isoform X1 [Apteryx mantelli mantelli]XP_013800581.1 PREDICTED: leucine-rich repeat and IQ domain-containing protein 3 isoform X1 [Apteryx mantelli mantelli]XP_013800582.1 PREDICTED: leucine-rich repeat and IQ domain-containing protein 3 isoform X1 [Apteryx mantelli mantelli]